MIPHKILSAFILSCALLLAQSADATPPPLTGGWRAPEPWDVHHRLNHELGFPTDGQSRGDSIDIIHSDLEITLDPSSGQAAVHGELTLRRLGSALSQLRLLIDHGLAVSGATATGHSVSVAESSLNPYNYVVLTFSPSVAAETEVVLSVDYGGQLECINDLNYGEPCHSGAGELGFYSSGSVFPWIYDPSSQGFEDRLTESLTVHLPSGSVIAATGDLVSSVDDGDTNTSTWEMSEPMCRIHTRTIITGAIDALPVTGAPVESEVYYDEISASWTDEMAAWILPILTFLEGQSGQALPYDHLSLIKLPADCSFPGTASYGMTLLAESYSLLGDEGFEEIWAHENIHQWWGVAAYPIDQNLTSWLTEGLTTMSQVDYTYERHHGDEDRDSYLARRYRDNDLMLRYLTDPNTLPPVVLQFEYERPSGALDHTIWAYYKGAALLEYLRVILGEDSFNAGLVSWAETCRFADCDSEDFRQVMEDAEGVSLDSFFAQFIYDTTYAAPVIGFTQQPGEGESMALAVTIDSDATGPLPLQLWIEMEDGSLERQQITADPGVNQLVFSAGGTVRSVRPNPRLDAVVHGRSAVDGDLNFDGEMDGLDLLHCAWRLDKKVEMNTIYQGESIYGLDLTFDPRCDRDGDGALTDADLADLEAQFPQGRTP